MTDGRILFIFLLFVLEVIVTYKNSANDKDTIINIVVSYFLFILFKRKFEKNY